MQVAACITCYLLGHNTIDHCVCVCVCVSAGCSDSSVDLGKAGGCFNASKSKCVCCAWALDFCARVLPLWTLLTCLPRTKPEECFPWVLTAVVSRPVSASWEQDWTWWRGKTRERGKRVGREFEARLGMLLWKRWVKPVSASWLTVGGSVRLRQGCRHVNCSATVQVE